MVLESLVNPFSAKKHPFNIFFLGAVYASVALFLGLWVFENQAGLVMVFLTVLACVPLFYHTMIYEEQKDFKIKKEWKILKEHSKALFFFIMLFLGVTAALTFWYVVLPSEQVEKVFNIQMDTINNINSNVSGQFIGTAFQRQVLSQIVLNNIKVMIFSLFFSLIYGAGAIFILIWNASVIATAFGNFIRTYVSYLMNIMEVAPAEAYFKVVSLSILRYSIHGIPEVLSYFVAGLAGGILSVAIIRQDFKKKKFEKIMLDFTNLVVIAIIMVLISGVIEVFITPTIFQSYHQIILAP